MSLLLSILDQSPVPDGSSPAQALRNSVDLAQRADRLGYHRYWVAEHHNMDGLAGSAPEILIGHIADHTERIRVGSGGVMLSHYSPLKVAEGFRVLEALHPGRIDIGLGRAPGSDGRTAMALARGGSPMGVEHYPTAVRELRQFLHDRVPDSGPMRGIAATPRGASAPEMWLLASSPDSASIAAHFGFPLSWAHFIDPRGAAICRSYIDEFVPSVDTPEPRLSIGLSVLCADTDAEADRLATSIRTWRASGLRGPIPPPASPPTAIPPAAAGDPLRIVQGGTPLLTGTPDRVRAEMERTAAAYGADEVVVVSICHDHDARVHSYELLADVFGLSTAPPP